MQGGVKMIYFQQCQSAAILALHIWEKNLQNLNRSLMESTKLQSGTTHFYTEIASYTSSLQNCGKKPQTPLYYKFSTAVGNQDTKTVNGEGVGGRKTEFPCSQQVQLPERQRR